MARKILLADDSVTAQNMGRKILADAGYEVITVNNGSAALKKIGEQRPDLIVLDVYMPGYSGLEVCQRLKEAGDTSRIPILLTVGKLEPFKPEEAKRVRADGYIVKPFEASELLSTLSKLEDKVVPRSESSKPGRFARATAAIEEGRYDKSMAVEEDAGWKNRISFPSRKREKAAEQEIDTGEIYNPVNKDLRTVVENKPPESAVSESAEPAQAEPAHINVSAVAPEGLPKDVTPEEIAALAAAAAQMKGKVGEEVPAAPVAEGTAIAPPLQEASKTGKTAVVEAKAEEVRPVEAEPVPEVAPAPQATFAEQAHSETVEEKKSTPATSSQTDAMTAIMGLETQVMAVFSPGNGKGAREHEGAEKIVQPMTMAAAAAAQTVDSPVRWSAVAVALSPEEAALSLEQEMQKAYADFAAAESGHTSTVAESSSAALATTSSAVIDAPAPQVETAIPAAPAPEVAQGLSAVSEAATEAMSAAVKELEVVAAKYEAEHAAGPTEAAADKSRTAEPVEPHAATAEVPAKVEQKVEGEAEPKPEPGPENEPGERTLEAAPTAVTDMVAPEDKEIEPEASTAQAEAGAEPEQPSAPAEVPEPEAVTDVAAEESETRSVSTDPVPVSNASTAKGTDDMAKRESDTAAAWASWRKVRETGGPRSNDSSSEDVSQDKAAMAVAAGAENKPEEVAALDSDPEISSLVDSVLADMRPKIVEEIARKLGKKK